MHTARGIHILQQNLKPMPYFSSLSGQTSHVAEQKQNRQIAEVMSQVLACIGLQIFTISFRASALSV